MKGQQDQSAEEGKTSWPRHVWCFCTVAMETREPGTPEVQPGQTTSLRAIEANTVACPIDPFIDLTAEVFILLPKFFLGFRFG